MGCGCGCNDLLVVSVLFAKTKIFSDVCVEMVVKLTTCFNSYLALTTTRTWNLPRRFCHAILAVLSAITIRVAQTV